MTDEDIDKTIEMMARNINGRLTAAEALRRAPPGEVP